ncbi:MAG: polyprenyl synthetase [Desulfuromonas sp.]|nr:MAG: polyprenyl synthetase [Desulfuromonas sp.]
MSDAVLQSYLENQLERITTALESLTPSAETLPAQLHEAMRYSLLAGGKRIRPVLLLAACEAVGGENEAALPIACALEMIHTYSLVHDDLPAMDNDDYRRGRLTNHKVYGEATAVLAGDALLTEAFIHLSDPARTAAIPPQTLLEVIHIMARCAGSMGMVGGQVVDMEAEGKEIDFATLEYIHTHKTGALLLASVKAGGLVGGADAEQLESLTRYGEAAGLAFQIADDILNVTGDKEELGKAVGSDEARGKATYPALLGVAEAKRRAIELRDLAISALEPLGEAAQPLRDIAHYIVNRSC